MASRAITSHSERDTVELISAGAACQASSDAISDTLQDLGLPASAMQAASAQFEGPDPFGVASLDASALLEREEDGFVSALAVILVPGVWRENRRVAAVARPFAFVTTLRKRERVAVVAQIRFETDFASIPWWARWLISPFGRHAEAAVIHDWLYAIGEPGNRIERRRADDAFREALKMLRVSFLLRSILHRSVRIAGARGFGRPDSFTFRHLSDLSVVERPSDKTPFLRTVAVKSLQRGEQARTMRA